ncbi:MAG: glycosyltransferase [Solirubrobacterales bacterium]
MTSAGKPARTRTAPPPLVSVIVPVLNGEATVGRCLESLCRDSYPEDRREIVVVDNGSTDRTVELVRNYPVRLVVEPARGLSRARNRGIEESEGKLLAFTDADCYVSTRWLGELTAGFDQDDAAAVTGDVVPYPPTTPAERYSARRKPSVAGWQRDLETPWFCFMNAAVRRDAFDRVGLFDARFAGIGCEDIDFAWRFDDAGLRVRRQPQPVVFHQQRMTPIGLFRQNLRNGRGWALLHQRYPERAAWGPRDELAAWADIGRTARDAALAPLRARREPKSAEPEYPRLDLVLKLGQRLGFVHGRMRGWIDPSAEGDRPEPARAGGER